MKKYKHFLHFLIPICLLIIIPLIPFTLSKWSDERLISSIGIEDIQDHPQQTFHTSKLDTLEKIKLLSSYYGENEQNIILVSQKETQLNTHMQDIKSQVQVELNKLQKLNIFPNINFDNDYNSYSYTTRVFSQPTDPEKSVVVDIITYSNQSSFIEIWIDAQSQIIYQYLYYSQLGIHMKTADIPSIFGQQYLNISNEDVKKFNQFTSNDHILFVGIKNLRN